MAISHTQVAADPVISIVFALFQLFCYSYDHTKVLGPHWSFHNPMGRFLVWRFMPSHRSVVAIGYTQIATDPVIYPLILHDSNCSVILMAIPKFWDPIGAFKTPWGWSEMSIKSPRELYQDPDCN